ncbi:MAG: imidazole glycerol phosphate synthase subunit HisF [Planctomycetia bacterium]|nr:imidazole glycerol phosphate synthase subunit HisF [Planctomycetia bacterium]
MDYRRIIPCLDTRDGKLVKGINFVNLKELGDPADAGAAYCDAGADELVFLDITATLEGRRTFFAAVERTVKRLSVPLTVGGGIRSIGDIRTLFDLGVAKVSMNSAAVQQPEFVREAAQEFGSERITVAIDTRKNERMSSSFEVVVRGGTRGAQLDAIEWTKKVVELGAGAILPTSMDADGTQTGYDLPMTRAVADAAGSVPVIASGGAGKLEHLYDAIAKGGADAVLVASIAHYGTYTIEQMKRYLADRGIPVRST